MTGKPDQATQKVSCQGERLTRRLTLADPARLATKPVQYEYLCASATLRHDRHKGHKGALCRSRTAGQGDARNETARKQNTSASAFQAKGDLRLECRYLRGLVSDSASASALHRMDGKVISRLPGFRIFAASLPLPPHLFTAGYRDPEQL
jgi:hypothetical protein